MCISVSLQIEYATRVRIGNKINKDRDADNKNSTEEIIRSLLFAGCHRHLIIYLYALVPVNTTTNKSTITIAFCYCCYLLVWLIGPVVAFDTQIER